MIATTIGQALARRGYGAQTELADALGIRVQTVNKWVQGQTAPRPDRWGDIEEALEMPPGTLAKVSGWVVPEPTPPPDVDPASLAQMQLEMSKIRDEITQLHESVEKLAEAVRSALRG